MTDRPDNWMEQAGGFFKLWADYQQNALRTLTQAAGPPATGVPPAMAMPGALEMSDGLRQAQELWKSSMEQWLALVQKALPESMSADGALKTLFDPNQWANVGLGPLDQVIEHLVDGPSYATLWTLDRKLLRAQKLRAEWGRDLAAFQMLMQAAWNKVMTRFLAEVNDPNGTPLVNWRDVTDAWIKVANDTLTETHRTAEFLEAQRRLTRSGAECRLQEREIAEAFCEMHQMPTRTEMDEVQREVYELRRQLRALRHDSMSVEAPASAAPRPAAKRARSARPKPAPKREGD